MPLDPRYVTLPETFANGALQCAGATADAREDGRDA